MSKKGERAATQVACGECGLLLRPAADVINVCAECGADCCDDCFDVESGRCFGCADANEGTCDDCGAPLEVCCDGHARCLECNPCPACSDAEPAEPDEEDYQTEDFRTFYQGGEVAFVVGEDERWEDCLADHARKANYWPNVWQIDDHGGAEIVNPDA